MKLVHVVALALCVLSPFATGCAMSVRDHDVGGGFAGPVSAGVDTSRESTTHEVKERVAVVDRERSVEGHRAHIQEALICSRCGER